MPTLLCKFVSLLVLFSVALTGVADAIDLPEDARVPNWGGYCMWASLDTLARTHGITSLRSILRQRWDKNGGAHTDGGEDYKVVAELDARKVRYEYRPQFSNDRSLLEKHVDRYGAVVAFKHGTPHLGCHAVVVVNYDQEPAGNVYFYDPSKPTQNLKPKIWRVTREFFDYYWLGNSFVVFPDSGSDSPAKTPATVSANPSPAAVVPQVLVQVNSPYVP